MKKYRPEGWYESEEYNAAFSDMGSYWYEAGADAMLEALRDKGFGYDSVNYWIAHKPPYFKKPGKFVFIPDDPKE